MTSQAEEKIIQWIAPALEQRDLFLVDIKFPSPTKIQVFIDGDNNVHIDQCAEVSRHLEAYLDEDPSIPESYNLEVSSPGMSNPLKVPRQYNKRVGRVLDLVLQDGRKLEVLLESADDAGIAVKEVIPAKSKAKGPKNEVKTREELASFSYGDIKKATLKLNF